MAKKVVVFDYGSGNVHSAVKALERAGASVTLTRDRKSAQEAAGLVVPGVGAFAAVMDGLLKAGADQIIDIRLAGGKPVLGICVGLQVLFEWGSEHGISTPGLGQWSGVVEKLEAPRLPHMGWNTVHAPPGSALFQGVEQERFYFVHSYAVIKPQWVGGGPRVEPRVTWADHGQKFVAAVEDGPLSATQFHPEKSGAAGLQLLQNWVQSL